MDLSSLQCDHTSFLMSLARRRASFSKIVTGLSQPSLYIQYHLCMYMYSTFNCCVCAHIRHVQISQTLWSSLLQYCATNKIYRGLHLHSYCECIGQMNLEILCFCQARLHFCPVIIQFHPLPPQWRRCQKGTREASSSIHYRHNGGDG